MSHARLNKLLISFLHYNSLTLCIFYCFVTCDMSTVFQRYASKVIDSATVTHIPELPGILHVMVTECTFCNHDIKPRAVRPNFITAIPAELIKLLHRFLIGNAITVSHSFFNSFGTLFAPPTKCVIADSAIEYLSLFFHSRTKLKLLHYADSPRVKPHSTNCKYYCGNVGTECFHIDHNMISH